MLALNVRLLWNWNRSSEPLIINPFKTTDVSKNECLKLAATLKKVSDLPVSCRQYDDVVKIVEDNMNPYAGADRSVVSEAKIQRRLTTRRLTKKKDRFE